MAATNNDEFYVFLTFSYHNTVSNYVSFDFMCVCVCVWYVKTETTGKIDFITSLN